MKVVNWALAPAGANEAAQQRRKRQAVDEEKLMKSERRTNLEFQGSLAILFYSLFLP